jgi:alpha-tubulin suppressor-like RCC1 family protein
MPGSENATLLDLPLEMLTALCLHLALYDLVRIAETCKRLRHGDSGLETAELPTKSPVVPALRALAFARPEQVPSTRPTGCSESWVAYLARCTRQRRCREAPPFKTTVSSSMFVDTTGRLLACGEKAAMGHGEAGEDTLLPTPVAAMAGIRVRSVAAGSHHMLALGWDGGVYLLFHNPSGQLGHGGPHGTPSSSRLEGLEDVLSIDSALHCSFAVTQSGCVFRWGQPSPQRGKEEDESEEEAEAQDPRRPILVEGFGGVRVRRVCAVAHTFFAIGEAGELFSWGHGACGRLGVTSRTIPRPSASRRCGAFG